MPGLEGVEGEGLGRGGEEGEEGGGGGRRVPGRRRLTVKGMQTYMFGLAKVTKKLVEDKRERKAREKRTRKVLLEERRAKWRLTSKRTHWDVHQPCPQEAGRCSFLGVPTCLPRPTAYKVKKAFITHVKGQHPPLQARELNSGWVEIGYALDVPVGEEEASEEEEEEEEEEGLLAAIGDIASEEEEEEEEEVGSEEDEVDEEVDQELDQEGQKESEEVEDSQSRGVLHSFVPIRSSSSSPAAAPGPPGPSFIPGTMLGYFARRSPNGKLDFTDVHKAAEEEVLRAAEAAEEKAAEEKAAEEKAAEEKVEGSIPIRAIMEATEKIYEEEKVRAEGEAANFEATLVERLNGLDSRTPRAKAVAKALASFHDSIAAALEGVGLKVADVTGFREELEGRLGVVEKEGEKMGDTLQEDIESEMSEDKGEGEVENSPEKKDGNGDENIEAVENEIRELERFLRVGDVDENMVEDVEELEENVDENVGELEENVDENVGENVEELDDGEKEDANDDEDVNNDENVNNDDGEKEDGMEEEDVNNDENPANDDGEKEDGMEEKGSRPQPPTLAQVCERWGLTDVELEYSSDDCKKITSYALYVQAFRPHIEDKNPSAPLTKLNMLVAAKWRAFSAAGVSKPRQVEKRARVGVEGEGVEKRRRLDSTSQLESGSTHSSPQAAPQSSPQAALRPGCDASMHQAESGCLNCNIVRVVVDPIGVSGQLVKEEGGVYFTVPEWKRVEHQGFPGEVIELSDSEEEEGDEEEYAVAAKVALELADMKAAELLQIIVQQKVEEVAEKRRQKVAQKEEAARRAKEDQMLSAAAQSVKQEAGRSG